ncbi:hypothetical protein, partial [Rhizobium leguminosarum]|uniref:hypothetical protein n=1 Tax=Rhizobium leguminosarum TaxID=384 RepID=UPI0019D43357
LPFGSTEKIVSDSVAISLNYASIQNAQFWKHTRYLAATDYPGHQQRTLRLRAKEHANDHDREGSLHAVVV